jgi:hypothetical protein
VEEADILLHEDDAQLLGEQVSCSIQHVVTRLESEAENEKKENQKYGTQDSLNGAPMACGLAPTQYTS